MRHHFVLLVLTTLVCFTNAKGYYSQNNKQAFKQSRADDLKVCPKCQYDSDCEDGDVCTKNSCFYSEGHGYECRSFPIKDCVACDSTADCMKDNYDPCTVQECFAGRCLQVSRTPYCGEPYPEKTHTLGATAVNGRAKYGAMALDAKLSRLYAVATGAVDLSMIPSFVADWSCSGHGPGEAQIPDGQTITRSRDFHYPDCNPLLFQDLYGLVGSWFTNYSPAEDRQIQGVLSKHGKAKQQATFGSDNDDGFVIGLWSDRANRVSPYTIAQALAFIDMLTPSWVDFLDWDGDKKQDFNDVAPEVVGRWRPDGDEIVTAVAAYGGALAITTRPSCVNGLERGRGGVNPLQFISTSARPDCLTDEGPVYVYDAYTMDYQFSHAAGVWPTSVEFSDDGHMVVTAQGPGDAQPNVLVCDTNWNNPRNYENPRCTSLNFKEFDGESDADDSDAADRRHEMCLGGEGYIQDELYAFDYQRLTPFREYSEGRREELSEYKGFSARLEPTGTSFANNNYALVSLTINNGVAVVYLGDRYHEASIEGIVCLGVKNMLEEGNAFDGSMKDGGAYPENWPVFALYQPRKVLAVPSDDDEILFMTANGGAFSVDDVVQVQDINLDPGRFNIPEREITPEKLQMPSAIGELRVIKSQGRWATGEIFRYNERDRDEPGHDGASIDDGPGTSLLTERLQDKAWRIDEQNAFYEKLYMPGARSVSLWKLSLTPLMDLPTTKARSRFAFELSQMWDSGNLLETISDEAEELLPLTNAAKMFDDQSTGFGPAPTDIVTGYAYGMKVAVVSVTGGNYLGVMNIDNVYEPQPAFVITSAGGVEYEAPDERDNQYNDYTAIFGETGPKKLIFVSEKDSPTGCAQVLATNAGTKSIAVYQLGLVGMECEGKKDKKDKKAQ